MKQLVLAVASIGLLGVAIAPSARADEWNKKTILTVNETIQVPNKVLPPGTYVIKLLDSPSNRHVVQIFDGDETHLLTTILAIRTIGCNQPVRRYSVSGKRLPDSPKLCAPGSTLATISARNSLIRSRLLCR